MTSERSAVAGVPATCDVVVIGGGPAGTILGALLARRGYEVVLFDKERHPRYQVGESTIPHIWKYADLVGASERLAQEDFVEKSGGTVVWNGVIRQMAFKDFGYTRPGMHVERDRFDAALLEHARASGVRVFEKVAALRATLGDERSSVTYRAVGNGMAGEVRCRFVADASGQNAVLAKQLGTRRVDDGFRFMSVWGYFADSKYVAQGGQVHPFAAVRDVPPTTFVSSIDSIGEWGWLWHIPQRDATSVGLVLPQEEMKALKASDEALEAFFLRQCRELPYLGRLLEEARYLEGSFHVIRDYSYRSTTVTGPGFYLVGDAAGFVDPIFSVGVLFAMFTGYLAGWAIDRSLRQPRSAERNRRIYAAQLDGRLEVARALALPQYGALGSASAAARRTVHFESQMEQELMFVVSTLTTRNENVLDMVQRRDGAALGSNRFQVLDEIAF